MGPLCIGSVDNKVKIEYFHLNNIAWVPYGPHTRILSTWEQYGTHMRPLYYISVFTTDEIVYFYLDTVGLARGHDLFFC